MEIFTVKKNRNLIIAILFAVLILCSALLCFSPLTANADSQVKVDLFLPQTALEYKELTSPIDVYSDESVTAITQGGVSPSLLVYYQDKYTQLNNFTAIKQVKKLDQNTLLISDNASIHKIDLTKLDNPTECKVQVLDTNDDPVNAFSFDIYQNLLITSFSDKCIIYNIDGDSFVKNKYFTINDSDSIVAVNQNYIFFSDDDDLWKMDITTGLHSSFIDNISPAQVIANNEFVYYISKNNNKIYKADMQGNAIELQCTDTNQAFNLGNATAPSNLAFRADNLLIIQNNTIQEYKVEDPTIDFTGFAITSGKTAYNRVKANANIQKYNDTVAVLDDFKLTVIKSNSENLYERANFNNYFVDNEQVLGQDIFTFALGKDNALLVYNTTTSKVLKLLDFNNQEQPLTEITFDSAINVTPWDVCYQGENYYVLATDSNNYIYIYRLDKTSTSITDQHEITKISTTTNELAVTIFDVDVYGNIYLVSTNKIVKLDKAQGYAINGECPITNVKTLHSDLNGSLFALNNDGFYYIENISSNPLPINIELENITDFALDITNDLCYFTTSNQEQIFTTTKLQNLSISDIDVSDTFKTTNDSTNTASEDLQVYTVSADENVFIVTKNQDTLKYKAICDAEKEFIYACAITDNLHLLIGQDEIAISLSATNCPGIVKDTNFPESAYVSSSVNGYYYPIITLQSDYALTNADSQKVKLDKNTLIKPSFITTILDKDFYYATFVVDNVEYKGYVPIDYTVEVLEKDITSEQYTIETLTNTYLYSDAQLTNIKDNIVIENGTAVRVYEKQENYAKIAVNVDGQWIDGYVSTDCIIDSSTIAVRNILLIILVVTCLGTTSIYFLLKRKRVSK